MKQAKSKFLRRLGLLGVTLSVLVGALFLGHAGADTLVHGFKANGFLQPGWVVAITKNTTDTVEPAPANNLSRMYGVVIDPSQAPATVRKEGSQQIYVVNSGTFPVLVNTQNGVIHAGDYVSMSQTDGIASKASSQQLFVLGRAIEGFDGRSQVLVNGGGGTAIGRIQVDLNVIRNPLQYNRVAIPEPLKRAGEAIAGKNVSAERVYGSLAIFLISTILAGILLWSGVRSSIVSIGRNPLSRHSILQGLFQVIGAAAAVLIIGIIGVYLLLKL